MKDILVLGIESSCDETSVAVVKNGREILSNVNKYQYMKNMGELYLKLLLEII